MSIIKSNICDYGDAQIHVKVSMAVPNAAADTAPVNNSNKKVIFKVVLHLLIA